MKLSEEQQRLITAVEQATDQLQWAKYQQGQALVAARNGGVPISHLSEASGISRTMLYRRWNPDYRETNRALDRSLLEKIGLSFLNNDRDMQPHPEHDDE